MTFEYIKIGNDINGTDSGDQYGWSVSLSSDGNIVAIGSFTHDNYKGHVCVYQRDASNSIEWGQIGDDIDGDAADDKSGFSVSLSENGYTVAIGATGATGNSGRVRVYKYDVVNNSWGIMGSDIDGEYEDDESGKSVSLSSD